LCSAQQKRKKETCAGDKSTVTAENAVFNTKTGFLLLFSRVNRLKHRVETGKGPFFDETAPSFISSK
jgi:hypothetical protein